MNTSIDIHMHVFSSSSWDHHITGETIIEEMNKANVQKAVVISSGYFEGIWRLFLWTPFFGRSVDRVRTENDYVAKMVHRHSDRLIGACGVHPFDKWAQVEVTRCVTELGFRVVKVHPNAQRIDVMDLKERESLKEYLHFVGRLGAVVLIHALGNELEFLKMQMQLASEIPTTKFIFAHMFGDDFYDVVESIQGEFPKNIFFDLSGTLIESRDSHKLVETIRRVGISTVLFGSDYPVYTPKQTLEALKKTSFSPKEITNILTNIGPFGEKI